MVDRAHLVCVILATATFSFQSPPLYLVISPRTKGRKENRTVTMSQRETKKKISDTSLCGVGTALSAALSRAWGATFLGWRLGRQECGWATDQMGLRWMLFYSGFLASSSKEEGKKKKKTTNQQNLKKKSKTLSERRLLMAVSHSLVSSRSQHRATKQQGRKKKGKVPNKPAANQP